MSNGNRDEQGLIEQAVEAWEWRANTTGKDLMLSTPGGTTIMDFCRWGMNGAQPRFNVQGIMREALPMMRTPQLHNAWRKVGIDHPQARLIEQVPVMRDLLRRCLNAGIGAPNDPLWHEVRRFLEEFP